MDHYGSGEGEPVKLRPVLDSSTGYLWLWCPTGAGRYIKLVGFTERVRIEGGRVFELGLYVGLERKCL